MYSQRNNNCAAKLSNKCLKSQLSKSGNKWLFQTELDKCIVQRLADF